MLTKQPSILGVISESNIHTSITELQTSTNIMDQSKHIHKLYERKTLNTRLRYETVQLQNRLQSSIF